MHSSFRNITHQSQMDQCKSKMYLCVLILDFIIHTLLCFIFPVALGESEGSI